MFQFFHETLDLSVFVWWLEDCLLAYFFSSSLVDVVGKSCQVAELWDEIGGALAWSCFLSSFDFVLDWQKRLFQVFDGDVILLFVVLAEIWDILADGDVKHSFELNIKDSIEDRFSIGGHDDRVEECFFDLVSFLFFVFSLVCDHDLIDGFEDSLISDKFSGCVYSEEDAFLAFLEGAGNSFIHFEVINRFYIFGGEIFATSAEFIIS